MNIESNINPPNNKRWVTFLAKLPVGKSTLVNITTDNLRALYKAAKRNGQKIVSEKHKNKYRIWRVK